MQISIHEVHTSLEKGDSGEGCGNGEKDKGGVVHGDTKVEVVDSDMAPVCAPSVSIARENKEGGGQGEKLGSSRGHMNLRHPIFPRKACAA